MRPQIRHDSGRDQPRREDYAERNNVNIADIEIVDDPLDEDEEDEPDVPDEGEFEEDKEE